MNDESGAVRLCVGHGDLAAVLLDNAAGNTEAKSGGALVGAARNHALGREERIEDPVEQFVGYAGAGVGDRG